MTTECTEHAPRSLADSTLIASSPNEAEADNVIEDLFTFTSDFWAPTSSISQELNTTNKVRLNSYEDQSLSCSPESGFSNRSRISSGEDDLEVATWKNNKVEHWTSVDNPAEPLQLQTNQAFDPSLTELNAILEANNTSRMEFTTTNTTATAAAMNMSDQQQLEWTYLEPAQPTFNVVEGLETITTNAVSYPVQQQPQFYNPAVIVQPAWGPNNDPSNQGVNGEIHYEVIETIPVESRPIATNSLNLMKFHHHAPNNQRTISTSRSQHSRIKKSYSKSSHGQQPKDDKPRLCHVCSEQAGKHSYYGGQVCPSCRAFFRRSVQSKYSDIYKCSKGGACNITLKTRKNCQFCRFQACEKAGMKRSWVLADGESNKNKKTSPSSPSVTSTTSPTSPTPTSSSSSSVCSRLSVLDETKIRDCIEKMEMIKQQTEDLNPQVMQEFVQLVTNGPQSTMSRESRCAMKKVLEQRSRLFALNVPEFVSLSSGDQIILQEENIGPLIELRVATFFHTELKTRQQVDLILGQSDVLRLTSTLAGMDEEVLDHKHLEYEQFFVLDHTVCSQDQISTDKMRQLLAVMTEHKSLVQKISKWVEDETTFCLMNLILLFDPSESRKQLQYPDLIESHQLQYTELLYRYLLSRYPKSKARAKWVDGIRLVSHCRQLHHLAMMRCSMIKRCSESSSSSSQSSSEEN